jgi:hypothetical protein
VRVNDLSSTSRSHEVEIDLRKSTVLEIQSWWRDEARTQVMWNKDHARLQQTTCSHLLLLVQRRDCRLLIDRYTCFRYTIFHA